MGYETLEIVTGVKTASENIYILIIGRFISALVINKLIAKIQEKDTHFLNRIL